MKPIKSFTVFGEPVDVLTTGEMTNGNSSTITQTSPPGGGPPPHSHLHEDETFFVLKGDYELLMDGTWHNLDVGQAIHARRGSVHTFRNIGSTDGKILIFVSPAGMEKYLEEISPLTIPDQMAEVLAISDRYGISFAQ